MKPSVCGVKIGVNVPRRREGESAICHVKGLIPLFLMSCNVREAKICGNIAGINGGRLGASALGFPNPLSGFQDLAQ